MLQYVVDIVVDIVDVVADVGGDIVDVHGVVDVVVDGAACGFCTNMITQKMNHISVIHFLVSFLQYEEKKILFQTNDVSNSKF